MFKKLFTLVLLALTTVACSDDNAVDPIVIDSSLPQGTFTTSKSGTFTGQSGVNSTGMAQLGVDSQGTQFVRFSDDFMTNLATGTVTVYLSTSQNFVTDPGNGNPDLRLIGSVRGNNEQFFKITPNADPKFTHVILWCASANVPFGFALLN